MNRISVNIINLPPIDILINAVEQPYQNENVSLETIKKVIKTFKHDSVAEHSFINFSINGISRLCLQELARHRHTSLTVQSTRFTLNKMLDKQLDKSNIRDYFVFPIYQKPEWENVRDYTDYVSCLINSILNAVERMHLFKTTTKLSNDYLKYFVPESLRVNLAWSINIRSLQNFLSLRLCKSAHFEIRYLANLILNELKSTYVYELLDIEERW